MYVKRSELMCRCGCKMPVHDDVYIIANTVRMLCEFPYVSTSGARCPMHNLNEGGSETSSHKLGLADDVKFYNSTQKFKIIKALQQCGVTRIGINEDKKFIHWDIDKDKPQDVLFKY